MFHQANCTKRKTWFLLVSKHVNALYGSVLTSNGSILYIAQNQHFRESQIPKIKTEASVVINLFFKKYIYLSFPVTSINLISFIRMFAPLLCCYILRSFFWDVCFCFCLWFCSVFSVAFILFSFVFIFGQNLSPNSKDTDVTTASVELNIRTIITSLLLTLEIVHYLRELTVQ